MLQRMEYFDVYFLCQVASNLLEGGFERTVNDFFEPFSESYGEKNVFMKYSLLHDYCEWVIHQNIWDDGEDAVHSVREAYRMREFTRDKGTLWVDRALNHYFETKYDFIKWIAQEADRGIDQLSDTEIDDLRFDYLHFLQQEEAFDSFIVQLSNELFYILFQNRAFLYNFNLRISSYNHVVKDRIIIPHWAQRAVFFRDHGFCVFCGKDLSGTLHVTEDREIHYDHIISLADNGINDVSNIQLSCQQCNLKKSKDGDTSIKYQQWYRLDALQDRES